VASHPCFVAERGARLRLTPTAYRHLHTSKMHTMRDQHECHQHHREGECPACEVGVVLGRWLIRQFSPARHHHLHRTPKKYSRQRLADSRRLVPQKRPQRGEAEAVELSGLRDDANDRKVLLLSSRRPNVRFGSKAALTAPKSDFSFTPERWGNRPAQLVDS
jgi:hypothetical protein